MSTLDACKSCLSRLFLSFLSLANIPSTQDSINHNGQHESHDKLAWFVTFPCLLLIVANNLDAAMSSSQSSTIHPHLVNLNGFEMSIIESMRKEGNGQWSCEQCGTRFDNSMRLVTHLLTLCDGGRGLLTFSTESAVHICVALDELGPEILESYDRVAAEGADGELSDSDEEDLPPPRMQRFPATPPYWLSADAKREWTFRRDRK